MTEDFLHFLWRFRLLDPGLITMEGEELTVIHPGEYNRDGGPDFFNARLMIGKTMWAGNVEIHLKASDWFRHRHHHDHAYNNVILHVVETCDAQISRSEHGIIPVVEIRNRYPQHLCDRYQQMTDSRRWIPCEQLMSEAGGMRFPLWAPALAAERLENQYQQFRSLWHYMKLNWEETFYIMIARAMGCHVNTQPFEELAKSIPLKLFALHRMKPMVLEALLFGQAGLLDALFQEDYPLALQDLYRFYQQKYHLIPLKPGVWKFLRMRPSNFPTIRISQFAMLLCHHPDLFTGIPSMWSLSGWHDFFRVKATGYWDSHYTFGRLSVTGEKILGDSTILLLMINAVIPMVYLFGREKNLVTFTEQAIHMLEELPAEENSLISRWKKLHIPVRHALHTQALKQLKEGWCDRKGCLDCRMGIHLLQ